MAVTLPTLSRRQQILAGSAVLGLVVVTTLASWAFHGRMAPAITSFARCAQAGYIVSGTNPPTCNDGHQAFLGATVPTPSEQPPGQTLPFELMVEGDSGGNYPKRQEVITTESDWQRYWSQVHAGLAQIPPLLSVDFRASNVVALSSGRELTNGYGLKVTGVTASAAGTIVDATLTVPTITCAVANTATNRYFIAKTPKLTSPVSFRISTEYHHCP